MAENYWYSSLSGQEIEDTLLGAVRFNADQNLTTSQKAAARANIGAGESNSTFKILGYFDTLEDLQEWLQQLPQSGDAYGIGTASPYDVYVYDGIHNTWVNNGPIAYSDALIDDADISLERTWSSTKINTEVGAVRTSANAAQSAADAAQTTADGKAPISHASTAPTYGVGNGTNYGHLKLSDSPNASQGTGSGVAATPAAVQAAIDKATWTLLWTNPNPTARYDANIVQVDTTSYDFYLVIMKRSATDAQNRIVSQVIPRGFGSLMIGLDSSAFAYRTVYVSDNPVGFGFSDGAKPQSYGSSGATTHNELMVPYQIWGIKA